MLKQVVKSTGVVLAVAAMTFVAKACPKGTRTNFNWTTDGHQIDAYLYVV
jgi:hypothetical protein